MPLSFGCYEEYVAQGLLEAGVRDDPEEIRVLSEYAVEEGLCIPFNQENRFHLLEENEDLAKVRPISGSRTYWTPRAVLRPN